jgi:hypothetical protein
MPRKSSPSLVMLATAAVDPAVLCEITELHHYNSWRPRWQGRQDTK